MKHLSFYRKYLYKQFRRRKEDVARKEAIAGLVSASLLRYANPQGVTSSFKIFERFLEQFGA